MFGIKFGGSRSRSSSVSNSNSTSTTTKLVPEWASSLTQDVAGQVGRVAALNPYSLTPGANPLQRQAAAAAQGLGGAAGGYGEAAGLFREAGRQGANVYQPAFGEAADYGAGTVWSHTVSPTTGQATLASGASVLDNLDAYMSPYRQSVVDSALSDYDAEAGRTRAQLDLDLAGAGAFGGSGAALSRSMTEDALVRGRATTSANLLDQMFQRGASLASQDADRRQQLALANAGAANQFGLANMEALNGASQFNATSRNNAEQFNAAAQNAAAQFNAGARNQMAATNLEAANMAARFGAEAADRAAGRRMDAARGLGEMTNLYETNQRANIGVQADVGRQLRDIEAQRRQAPVTHAQQIVAMLNGLPISLFTGEQTQTSGSQTKVDKSKTTNWDISLTPKIPGPLGQILGA
jgi:hypothetical protein